jgi:hypothetical protein
VTAVAQTSLLVKQNKIKFSTTLNPDFLFQQSDMRPSHTSTLTICIFHHQPSHSRLLFSLYTAQPSLFVLSCYSNIEHCTQLSIRAAAIGVMQSAENFTLPYLGFDLAIYGFDNHKSWSNDRPKTCPRLPHLWPDRGRSSDWSKITSSMSRLASVVYNSRRGHLRCLGLRLFDPKTSSQSSLTIIGLEPGSPGLGVLLLYICEEEQQIKIRPTHLPVCV